MEFSESDEGKTVLASSGDELGVVDDVRQGAAFVKPLSDLAPPVRAQLGWGGDDRDEYRLDEARVGRVTGDEIHLSEP
jgi:hypothetical protein